MLRHFLLLIAACIAAPGLAAGPTVEIVGADFGVFVSGPARELILEPTDEVPRRAGVNYGWVIAVRTKKRGLDVREEYVWADDDDAAEVGELQPGRPRNIRLPQRRQVSQRTLTPIDGAIYGSWQVGPDEPAGRRRLEVYVEGRLAASFDYEMK